METLAQYNQRIIDLFEEHYAEDISTYIRVSKEEIDGIGKLATPGMLKEGVRLAIAFCDAPVMRTTLPLEALTKEHSDDTEGLGKSIIDARAIMAHLQIAYAVDPVRTYAYGLKAARASDEYLLSGMVLNAKDGKIDPAIKGEYAGMITKLRVFHEIRQKFLQAQRK